jgi:hypothetical protein
LFYPVDPKFLSLIFTPADDILRHGKEHPRQQDNRCFTTLL